MLQPALLNRIAFVVDRTCAVALVPLLALGACGDGGRSDCDDLQFEITLQGVDSLGNPRPIDLATLVQGGRRIPCTQSGVGMREARCTLDDPSAHTLEYYVDGVLQSRDFEALSESECRYASPRRLSLVYDGPSCDYAGLTAVVGALRDAEGAEPSGVSVRIAAGDEAADCIVSGGVYSCPALAPVSTAYTLYAHFPYTTFTQTAQVDFAECEIAAPPTLDFDLTTWECTRDPAPAARVYVHTRAADGTQQNALADEVTVRSRFSEPVPCALEDAPAIPGPRAYLCPTTTHFGSAGYTFAATRNGVTASEEQTVSSTDCVAETALVSIDFD